MLMRNFDFIRPKILYIIGQLRRGGAEQQLFYLLKHWPHSATVVVLEKNPDEAYWAQPIRDLGYSVVELERYGRCDIRRLAELIHQIRVTEPDIVHLFTDTPAGIYGRMAAILAHHPCVIVNERRHPSSDPSWFLALKRRWLNQYVAAVVTNARSSRDFIVSHLNIPPEKAYYIPNGLELERFKDAATGQGAFALLPEGWNNKVIIGTVGSLLPKKAPEVWLKVARRVADACPEARFLHVGKGPMLEVVENLRDALGLGDRVYFMGEQFNVLPIMKTMDIFTLTSRNEGMPNAAMEAMAMQLPCVVTDAGDSREIVRDGETGFVVPIGHEIALAERILHLIHHPELRRKMGERGFAVMEKFSVQNMKQQYESLYLQLLQKNHNSSIH